MSLRTGFHNISASTHRSQIGSSGRPCASLWLRAIMPQGFARAQLCHFGVAQTQCMSIHFHHVSLPLCFRAYHGLLARGTKGPPDINRLADWQTERFLLETSRKVDKIQGSHGVPAAACKQQESSSSSSKHGNLAKKSLRQS